MCAGRIDSVNALGISKVNDGINKADSIDLVVCKVSEILNVLDKYQENYDLILIESDSLDNSSDALLISNYVDFKVLLTECNKVSIDKFYRKVTEFENYSSGIDGVILKSVTKENSSYKYIENSK